MILFRQEDGNRTVHFDDVWLILEGGRFSLEIPRFESNEWNITPLDSLRDRSPRGVAEQKVQISGRRALSGCLAIPEEMQSEESRDAPQGTIVFKGELPFQGAETFAASFEFEAADAPGVSIIGEITSGKVLDLHPKDLAEKGKFFDARSGETRDVDAAMISHYPHINRLTIDYQVREGRGSSGGSLHVVEFPGKPGVVTNKSRSHVDGEWVDMVDIAIVDAFGEGVADLEIREIPAADFPEEELTPDAARGLGILKLKLRTGHVAVRPERPRID